MRPREVLGVDSQTGLFPAKAGDDEQGERAVLTPRFQRGDAAAPAPAATDGSATEHWHLAGRET